MLKLNSHMEASKRLQFQKNLEILKVIVCWSMSQKKQSFKLYSFLIQVLMQEEYYFISLLTSFT